MRRTFVLTALALLMTLEACGQSDEEKAKAKVCDARDDIQTQVRDLQNPIKPLFLCAWIDLRQQNRELLIKKSPIPIAECDDALPLSHCLNSQVHSANSK